MAGPADPFSLGEGDVACLLLHGLTGSPAEVRPVGEALARAGFRAVAPLLPGHGTTPRDLMKVGRGQMLAAAADALRSLRDARRVFVCGLSRGALLSVELCARIAERDGAPAIAALALLAPAVRMARLSRVYTEVIGRLPSLPIILGKGARDIAVLAAGGDQPAAPPDGSYQEIPWNWGRELRLLAEEALSAARLVHVPTLLLHGSLDRTASPAGTQILRAALGGPTRVVLFERSGHVLPLDAEGPQVAREIVGFFQEA
ncbi:MAG: alpha/beta hydrolase [Myxococcales bacterium]